MRISGDITRDLSDEDLTLMAQLKTSFFGMLEPQMIHNTTTIRTLADEQMRHHAHEHILHVADEQERFFA